MQVAIQDGYTVISDAPYGREFALTLKREFPKDKTGLKWHPDRQVFTLSTKYYQRARAMFDVPRETETADYGMTATVVNITRNPDQPMTFIMELSEELGREDPILIAEQTLRDYERDSGMIRISRMSHYAALGIEQTSDEQVIQKAYKAMARRVHPDLNKGAAWAHKSSQLLNESYAILSNPLKRARYDVGLQMARVTMEDKGYTPYCTSGAMALSFVILDDGTRKAVKILEWLANSMAVNL